MIARAFGGLLVLLVVLGLALFLPAGTIAYWQAWVYMVCFTLCVIAITVSLMMHDRALLERRIKAGPLAETTATQKLIQSIAQLAFLSVYVISALDWRNGWSSVPIIISIGADGIVITGFFIVYRVFRENTFTSATIEVGKEQQVVTTGPYSVVRHPMYSGALLMLLATPPALGSWWGLLTVVPMMAVIVWRLLDEEKFLEESLQGYSNYMTSVRWRLLPNVF